MRRALAASFLLIASLAAGSENEVASARKLSNAFHPQTLSFTTSWTGPQFVQAGQDGGALLLRGETFEVYPLTEGGLGEPERLERLTKGVSLEHAFMVLGQGETSVQGAAMSPAGDWLIQEAFEVRLFRGGKEEPVPSPGWWVLGVGWLRDEPVISGVPRPVLASIGLKKELPSSVPFLVTWDGDRWEPLTSIDVKDQNETSAGRFLEGRTARLFSSPDGALWVAFDDQHRFRKYSSGGTLLTEIVVAGGQSRAAGDAERRQGQLEEYATELSKAFGRQVSVSETLSARVSRAVAEGADGRVYFLVEGEGRAEGAGLTLERFDPVLRSLERLALRLPSPGLSSMAASDDGLYIAAREAKRGLWRLAWEELEKADWEPAGDAVLHSLDPLELEGAWKEQGKPGLVRFGAERVVTFENGQLTVRGIVSLTGNELLLRRSGFGETWKVWRQGDVLRLGRDGEVREYRRLARIPPEVSLAPVRLGKPGELPQDETQAIQAEVGRRLARLMTAQEKSDPQEAQALAAENQRYLRELTTQVGWLDVRRFGFTTASRAVALVRGDILLMLAALPVVERDFKSTPEGAPLYSEFHDALQILLGGKQRYGTQIVNEPPGDPVVLPLDRRAEVDAARRKLGLTPLADHLRQLSRDSFHGKPIRIADGEVLPVRPGPSAHSR